MPAPYPENPASSTTDERRSARVFTGVLLLVLLAVAFPQMSPQGLQGILWTGAGFLMLLWPPVVRLPRLWGWLVAGFVLFSLVGFLPREWFQISPWRGDLEKLGLDTGASHFVQAGLAVEVMAGFAVTAVVALFLLGHRVDSRCNHRLALGFALGVGAWTAAALVLHKPGELFGFFPNRNHSASLLVMGTFAGLGSLAHAIRRKIFWKILLAAIPVSVCLYALHAVSESRAGVVLVFAGFLLWTILIGFRHLQGNVGKALILIVIAASGTFLIVDSTAKKRLTTSVEQLTGPALVPSMKPENPFTEGAKPQPEPPADGRIAIFQDTLEMIRHESWTGVGPGQFAQVFPQYRNKINASNDAKCLHPESDWLMMLAEIGWPATLCLAAGVFAVFYSAIRQARRGSSRFLRTGCIVAALLLSLHGIFDVPGHRVGLAWAAVLLLASSLRAQDVRESSGASRLSGHCWRGLGLTLIMAGIFLIQAQWGQRSVLPSEQVRQAMFEAKTLYIQDQAAYDRAKAEGREYEPISAEDSLEMALLKVKHALEVTPLDPYLHSVCGSLALHYDDKHAIANQAFAIQRRLEPSRVNLPMEQARAWHLQDLEQVISLWKEALQRAAREKARFPASSFGTVFTYQRVLDSASKDDFLVSAALDLAGGDSSLVVLWARSAPVFLLDREMPRLLAAGNEASARQSLFQIWEKRGTKDAASNFGKNHPELDLPPP